MKELGTRVILIVIAFTALGTLFAMFGGFVNAVVDGWLQYAVQAVIALVFVAAIAGLWAEFGRVDDPQDDRQSR